MLKQYLSKMHRWSLLHPHPQALVWAWQGAPDVNLLQLSCQQYQQRWCYWFIFADEKDIQSIKAPIQQTFPHLKNISFLLNTQEKTVLLLNPRTEIWIIHPQKIMHFWQDCALERELICFLNDQAPSHFPLSAKSTPWYDRKIFKPTPCSVIVVGGGIAGACSAYFLAHRGLQVTLLEKNSEIAKEASGNYQGVLYAKMSAADTAQCALLRLSYPLSVSHLRWMDPQGIFSDCCGILHLDYDSAAIKRHRTLMQQSTGFYRSISAKQADDLAGLAVGQGGLFWPDGAWVAPQKWIKQMLHSTAVKLHCNFMVSRIERENNQWWVYDQTGTQSFNADALILALGADLSAIYRSLGLRFYLSSGQSALVSSTPQSKRLAIVLSGQSYIAPAYRGYHCFGSTFHSNCQKQAWSENDAQLNKKRLAQLAPYLYDSFAWTNAENQQGHHALRSDSFDHLPTVGPVGDAQAMRRIYAKLGQDKRFVLQAECPYIPHLYINTAHGTRGLVTAPLAALSISAEVLGLPQPLGERLRHSIHPNRLIIRDIIKGL